MSDRISSFFDLTSLEAEKEKALNFLNSILDTFNKLNGVKISFDGAKNIQDIKKATEEYTGTTANLTANLSKLHDMEQVIIKDEKEKKTATDGSKNSTDAQSKATKETIGNYDKLIQQLKDAKKELLNLAAAPEIDTDSLNAAIKKVQELEERLANAKKLSSGKLTVATENIPFTTNLADLEEERNRTKNATGTTVNENDLKEAQAANDATAFSAAQQQVNQTLKQSKESISEISTEIDQYTGSITQNIQAQTENKIALAQNKAQQKEIETSIKESGSATESQINKLAALRQEEVLLSEQNKALSQTITNQAKLINADAGSTDEMQAKISLLTQAYEGLTKAEKQSSFGVELKALIDDINPKLNEAEQSLGKFSRNVGNYFNSLSPLFTKLSEEISRLKTEAKGLQDLRLSNPIGFQLSGGDDKLNQINASVAQLERVQQVGFKTSGSTSNSTNVAQINTLRKSFDDLSKSEVVSKEFLEQFKTELSGIKVPDYTGNFRGAFNVLITELNEVREKLKDPALSGVQLEGLQREEQLLSELTLNLSRGFTTTREELRAFQDAAKKLGIDIGTDTETFVQFTSEVGKVKDTLDDVQAIIKNKSSDTRFLDAAVGGVNALAGAYGAAQGAAQLFDNDNEHLQKTMVKLQALLTIINGLQAIQNTLQTESGVVQGILAAKLGVINAAKAVEAKLFTATATAAEAETVAVTESVVATEAAVVANTENATAIEATTIAQGESIVATEGVTVALEGEAAAATTATAATSTFRTTLIASGIGAAILAVGAAIAFVVSKVNDWVGSTQKAIKQQNDLADAVKGVNEAIVEQASLVENADQGMKRYFQNQLDLSTAAGASQVKQFALKKQLFEEDKRLAQQQVDLLGVTNHSQAEQLTQLESLAAKKEFYNNKLKEAIINKDDTGAEAAKTLLENTSKEYDKLSGIYEAGKKAREDLFTANKNLDQLSVEETKFTADERRKLILESTQIEADLIKTKNESILNDERSSLEQRLKAIRSNATAERSVIEAQKNDVLNNPSSSAVDKTLAIKKAAEEERKVTIQTKDAIEKTTEEFESRELAAKQEVLKTELQLEVDINKQIATNQVFSLQQRLDAQKKFSEDQKKLIDEDYRYQLQQAGLTEEQIKKFQQTPILKVAMDLTDIKKTPEELIAIAKAYESAVLKLAVDTNKSATQVLKDEISKQDHLREEDISYIKSLYDKLSATDLTQYASDVTALNNALNAKELSYSQYNVKRRNLDREYAKEVDKVNIESLKNQIDRFKLFEGDRSSLEQKAFEAYQRIQQLKEQLASSTNKEEQVTIAEQLGLSQTNYDDIVAKIDKLIALEKALAEAQIKGSDTATKTIKENAQELIRVYGDLASAALDFASTLGDGSYTRQNNAIQTNMDLLERRKEKEIETVNQSLASQEEKNKQISKINARSAAEQYKLEQQQKQAQVAQAQFDKEMAALKIVAQTAIAVVTDNSNPLTVWKVPYDIALGAIELATVLAQPLPKYFRGRSADDPYEGYAIVGDGGKQEAIIRKSGEVEITPAKDTVTYVEKGDVILPDARQLQDYTIGKPDLPDAENLVNIQMLFAKNKTDQILQNSSVLYQISNVGIDTESIIENNNKNARMIAKAIKDNKTKVVVQGRNRELFLKYGSDYHKYI